MRIKLLKELEQLSKEEYKNFSLKLLPKETKLLGVKIPLLKIMAKTLIKNNLSTNYLSLSLKDLEYQEEKMLYSLLIAFEKQEEVERLDKIKQYIPYIKNWSECDTFCASLKSIKENQEFYYNKFLPYTQSNHEYEIRFFYVIALNYFINDTYLSHILNLIKSQTYVGYYDRMAVAWFLSIAFISYPSQIRDFLKNTSLDTKVYQKTISKINDSYQIKQEAKQELKSYLAS